MIVLTASVTVSLAAAWNAGLAALNDKPFALVSQGDVVFGAGQLELLAAEVPRGRAQWSRMRDHVPAGRGRRRSRHAPPRDRGCL